MQVNLYFSRTMLRHRAELLAAALTLTSVSHDREFVTSLATRVIEIKDQQLIDFQRTYEEYLDNPDQTAKTASS
ncbi:MAG: ATPase subunit of ABC transporter with duplicated ATPase domains [Oceanicoccus sp.]|jgi:ATPase subunit of ABC transporter with duplicated ATPase domains